MLQRLITTAAIAASVAAAACGDDADRAGHHPAAERTVRAFFGALAEGDGTTVCRLLTAGAQDEVVQRTSFGTGAVLGGGGSCGSAVVSLHADLDWEQKEALRSARVHELELLEDDRVRIDDADVITDAEYAGVGSNDVPMVLRRQPEGDWKIEQVG